MQHLEVLIRATADNHINRMVCVQAADVWRSPVSSLEAFCDSFTVVCLKLADAYIVRTRTPLQLTTAGGSSVQLG